MKLTADILVLNFAFNWRFIQSDSCIDIQECVLSGYHLGVVSCTLPFQMAYFLSSFLSFSNVHLQDVENSLCVCGFNLWCGCECVCLFVTWWTLTCIGFTAAMAEWLRRWTWNPMGSPRAGSNPAHSVTSWTLSSKNTESSPPPLTQPPLTKGPVQESTKSIKARFTSHNWL